ncbi:hypothetical protein HQ576_15235 [bacterium]|nr:hypothetical protein [bacterium]
MATRRISRGRGGSPVPIIVLSVIIVGLIASTVVLGMKASQLQDDFDGLAVQLRDAKSQRQNDLKDFRNYENLVGLDHEAAKVDFAKLKQELMDKAALEGEDRTTPPDTMKNLLRRYADRCALLDAQVRDRTQELGTSRKESRELELRAEAVEKSKQEEAQKATERHTTLQGEKEKVEGVLRDTSQKLSGDIEKLKAEKQQLQTKLVALEKDVQLARKTVQQKDELIDKLRNPVKPKVHLVDIKTTREAVDGKVLTVEPDGEYVMIDVGRRDWVSEGMEFRVFDETNPEARKEKGRIQVRRVYDTISQAKILDNDPLDPMLRDMAIINPAFSRGRQLKFVLEGRFIEPNLERLLGRYPCTIEREVTPETDYFVVGEAKRRPGEPSWKDSPQYGNALKYKVDILKERELLRYLGER